MKGDSVGKRENRKEKERSIRESKKKNAENRKVFLFGLEKRGTIVLLKGEVVSLLVGQKKNVQKKIVNRKPRL